MIGERQAVEEVKDRVCHLPSVLDGDAVSSSFQRDELCVRYARPDVRRTLEGHHTVALAPHNQRARRSGPDDAFARHCLGIVLIASSIASTKY